MAKSIRRRAHTHWHILTQYKILEWSNYIWLRPQLMIHFWGGMSRIWVTYICACIFPCWNLECCHTDTNFRISSISLPGFACRGVNTNTCTWSCGYCGLVCVRAVALSIIFQTTHYNVHVGISFQTTSTIQKWDTSPTFYRCLTKKKMEEDTQNNVEGQISKPGKMLGHYMLTLCYLLCGHECVLNLTVHCGS